MDSIKNLPLDDKRYNLKELLGKGGQASVYKAYDQYLKREVAIKIFPYQSSEPFTEGQALARCDSPHVIKVFDICYNSLYLCIIMEFVENNFSLCSHSIADMSEEEFYPFFYQTVCAVEEIHNYGLLHLDIKPENILIDADGLVKLTDFGISAIKGWLQNSNRPIPYKRKGSWYCLSPEQLTCSPVSEATDVFSLGILLHTFLFKKHPFLVEGDLHASQENIINAKVITPIIKPNKKMAPLVDICQIILQKNPNHRATLKTVKKTLEKIKQEKNNTAFPKSLTETIDNQNTRRNKKIKKNINLRYFLALLLLPTSSYTVLLILKNLYHTNITTTLLVPFEPPHTSTLAEKATSKENADLFTRLTEEEIENAIIEDKSRRLVSKREWGGSRDWKKEATQNDVDEIISGNTECDITTCQLYTFVYSRKKQKIINSFRKTIPHQNLVSASNIISQLIKAKLSINKTKNQEGDIKNEDLKKYLTFSKKIESLSLTEADVIEFEKFSKNSWGFLNAKIALVESFIAMHKKYNNKIWIKKSRKLIKRLREENPNNILVIQTKFKVDILEQKLQKAKQALTSIESSATIDAQRLFLDKTKLSFILGNPKLAYNEFIEKKNIRLTHDYFHEKAYMELHLNITDELSKTANQWIELFPSSDTAKSFLGNSYISNGNMQRAIDVYQDLLNNNDHYRYHINLSTALLLAGRYKENLQVAKSIIQNFPPSTYSYLSLGEAYKALKSPLSQKAFEKALELAQNSSDRDHGNEALLLAHLNRKEDALIALQKEAREEKNDGWFHMIAAQVYCLIGEIELSKYNGEVAVEKGFKNHWFNIPWTQQLYLHLAYEFGIDNRALESTQQVQ